MNAIRRMSMCSVVVAGLFSAAEHTSAQSTHAGMGAIPYTDGAASGVAFRTWAPNATAVSVAGTFNSWSASSHPLISEGNGYWSKDVATIATGHQYQFVIRTNGVDYWKTDSNATRVTNSIGVGIIYKPTAYQWQVNNFQIANWNELVLYELHIGTFNVPSGTTVPGSFAEASARLDRLKDLGINAVEVMPIQEFPGAISWGYNGCHPWAVESDYGGPDAFKAFVDAAHARGIAVIIDLVFSHLGPNDLDLWQYDGFASPASSGGIFFYPDWRANTPWGNTRPDFNRSEVRQYLRDNVLYWLNEFRCDGVRMDGTKYIRKTDQFGADLPEGWSLLQWMNDSVNAQNTAKLMIAEDLDLNHLVTKTTGEGGAGFDAQWDPSFYPVVRSNLIESNDQNRNMAAVKGAMTYSYNGSAFQRVIYTESHDEVANGQSRLPEQIWPGNASSWFSRKRSTLGAALVLTSAGIPMLFQGQEFLEDGWFTDTEPVDWSKETTFAGIRDLYQDLIAMRLNATNCTRGLTGGNTSVYHLNEGANVLASHRWRDGGAGDDVVVVMNFHNATWSNYRIGFPRAGQWKLHFNSDATLYGSDYANTASTDVWTDSQPYDGLAQSALIKIGPYSSLVFSQGDCTAPPTHDSADLNQDGSIGGADLALLMGNWGGTGLGDINNSGSIDGADLGVMLGRWGG